MSARLERVTDSAPRDAEYLTAGRLQALSGQPLERFGDVVLKEAIDNSLDACESAGITPEITVEVVPGEGRRSWLRIADNGTGIPAWKVAEITDFSTSTSDKAAYRSPTRGAQGSAWSCILGIPWALGLRDPAGTVTVEACGALHEITPRLVLGDLVVDYPAPQPSPRTAGTVVSVPLPDCDAPDVIRWAQDYHAINPHANITVHAAGPDGEKLAGSYKGAGQDGWRKWLPGNPTSAHWYSQDDLRVLVAAHRRRAVAEGKPPAPVGTFIRSFHGLTGSQAAARVKAAVRGVATLADFEANPGRVRDLLTAMQENSRPPKPAELGKVPAGHYRQVVSDLFGIERDRFWHARSETVHDGIAWAVDVAVAQTERPGRVIYGTNFGVPFGDPLAEAALQGDAWTAAAGAASFLMQAGAYPSEANDRRRAAIVHVQCASPRWNDTRKVALAVPDEVAAELAKAFAKATKVLRDERERSRKDREKEARRQEREDRQYWQERERREREPSLKETVRSLLLQAAGQPDWTEGMSLRTLYASACEAKSEVCSKPLTWRNFRLILAEFEAANGEIAGLVRRDEPDVEVDLDRHPRGPAEMKAYAARLGLRSYTALLALSEKNDPYAIGRPAEEQQAKWFAMVARRVGKVMDHIRGLHYKWFTAQGGDVDGSRYANDPEHWQRLSRAAKLARVLGMVDPESLSDRRNKALRVYTEPRPDTQPEVRLDTAEGESGRFSFPELTLDQEEVPGLEMPGAVVDGYAYSEACQPEVLVVVTEKLEDVLDPLCRELSVDLLPGTGYESYTRAIEVLRHAESRCQRVHVFYVSDYDPAGENMPVATARHCQFFAEQRGIKAEVTLERLALTAEQVERYRLPKAPDKKQTELDALEALHPGELAAIVRAAVLARRDESLAERTADAAEDAQAGADETWEASAGDLRAELDLIHANAREVFERHRESEQRKRQEKDDATAELRAQIKAIEDEIDARYQPGDTEDQAAIDAANDRLAQLAERVVARWDETEFNLPDVPEPDVAPDDDGLLYDSRRHWLDQLTAYQAAKAGTTPPDSGPEDDDQAA